MGPMLRKIHVKQEIGGARNRCAPGLSLSLIFLRERMTSEWPKQNTDRRVKRGREGVVRKLRGP